ncbi:MAG: ABC transporter permease [Pseudomonadota bacterium]
MIQIVASLIGRAVVVVAAAAFITFALLWNAPGDPALAIALARYDALVDADLVNQVREEAGMSDGFWAAFQAWIAPLMTGDFGNSSVNGRPVLADLLAALSYTFPLALFALTIGLVISLPLAVLATRYPGSLLDRFTVGLASIGVAIPAFWLGLLLILLFAVQLSWLPAMGARTPYHAILPALTLGLGVAASLTRIIRSGILEARGKQFLPAFRRRGVAETVVARDHIAPHAAVPVVTVIGLELAFLLEGLVAVEVIFARPGFGSFLVEAILARDYPQVQAAVIIAALIFVLINLGIDVFYRLLDPRMDVGLGGRDA